MVADALCKLKQQIKEEKENRRITLMYCRESLHMSDFGQPRCRDSQENWVYKFCVQGYVESDCRSLTAVGHLRAML